MKHLLLGLCLLFSVNACVTTPESGRRALVLTSEAQENEMGEQAYRETLAKERLANNPRMNAMLQRVGSRIAAAARKPDFKWEFKLIESKEKNAWCLPGGKVAFYTGILPMFENEAQMAAVMGHEVAHATARHGGQRITMAMGTQLGLTAASAIIGGQNDTKKQLLLAALGLGANIGAVLPFSRGHETEADEIGLKYMARAGYDPREAAKFWTRFAKEGSSVPGWLSTHPPSADRMSNLERLVPNVMPEYERSPRYGTGDKI